MKWTQDKKELIKAYLRAGMLLKDIAKELNISYKSVEGAINRYNLRENLPVVPKEKSSQSNLVLTKDVKKLRQDDITKLAQALGQKLYDNYKCVKLIEPSALSSISKKEEMSILDISDVHIGMINQVFDSISGKKIVTYNMDIFKKELNTLYKSVTDIHNILINAYNLRELTIFFLGDLITNDRIFKEQSFEIEKVVGLQIWDAVNYFTEFFNRLLTIYEKITIVGVVGNHGRSLPDSYEEPIQNNFEYFIYKIWEKQFADSQRVKVIVPESRRYIHKIYNWKHLIEHGDSMRGISDTSIERQIKELSLNIGGFDVMHYGHVHKLKEREVADKVIVKQNGCWIEKDDYGFRKFKTYSVPKQHFFGCNVKRPETWAYKIDLRG